MRYIHRIPFSPQEIESYRQLVFNNLTQGMKYVLDAMEDMELKLQEQNMEYMDLIENATDVRDGEPFPKAYYRPLQLLWNDPGVQKAWKRGNEAALPEKYSFPFISGPSGTSVD
jgi:guanine nucleotide-binding protein subunit alpha